MGCLKCNDLLSLIRLPYCSRWASGNHHDERARQQGAKSLKIVGREGYSFYISNWFHNLWNPEVQCWIHKSSLIFPILSRINQNSLWTPMSLRSILILSSHLHLGLPTGLFPAGVSVKILETLLSSSILATWSPHLNLLYLITLIVVFTYYTVLIWHSIATFKYFEIKFGIIFNKTG